YDAVERAVCRHHRGEGAPFHAGNTVLGRASAPSGKQKAGHAGAGEETHEHEHPDALHLWLDHPAIHRILPPSGRAIRSGATQTPSSDVMGDQLASSPRCEALQRRYSNSKAPSFVG